MTPRMLDGDWCESCGNNAIQKTNWGGVVCSRCSFTKFLCQRCGTEVGMPLSDYVQKVCPTCIVKEKWESVDERIRQRIYELLTVENGFDAEQETALLLDIKFSSAVRLLRRMRYSLKNNQEIEM